MISRPVTSLDGVKEAAGLKRREKAFQWVRAMNLLLALAWLIDAALAGLRLTGSFIATSTPGLHLILYVLGAMVIVFQVVSFIPLFWFFRQDVVRISLLAALSLFSIAMDSLWMAFYVNRGEEEEGGKPIYYFFSLAPLAISLRVYIRSGLAVSPAQKSTPVRRLLGRILSPIRKFRVLIFFNIFFAVVNSLQAPVIALVVSIGVSSLPGQVQTGLIFGLLALAWVVGSGSAEIVSFSQAVLTSRGSALLQRRVAVAAGLLEGDSEQLPSVFSQGIAKMQQAWDAVFYQFFPSFVKIVVQFIFSPQLA